MIEYLTFDQCTASELAFRMMGTILEETGIPSTCGIGT